MGNRSPIYRIVNTDNFGGDYPNESFVEGEYATEQEAQTVANTMNVYDYNPRYYMVVELPYKLQPGFEP